MNVFRKILSKLRFFFISVSAVVAVIMMLIILLDVTSRTITGRGINGSVQMIELGMLIVVFFATAQTQNLKEHVNVDLFVRILNPKMQRWLDVFMFFIYLVLCSILTYYTFGKAIESMKQGEVMWLGVDVMPQWPFRFIIPIGFFLMVLQLVDDFILASANVSKPISQMEEKIK